MEKCDFYMKAVDKFMRYKEFAIPFGIAALNGETFFSWGFFLNQCFAFVCKPCKRRGPMQLRSWGQKSEGQLCSV